MSIALRADTFHFSLFSHWCFLSFLLIADCRLSHMDASSCYRKLEGLPVAFTGKPTPKRNWKLALATSSFWLPDEKISFLIFTQAASVGRGSER